MTFIFKIEHFLVKHLPLQKCAKTTNVPDRFASTRTSRRVVALLTDSCTDATKDVSMTNEVTITLYANNRRSVLIYSKVVCCLSEGSSTIITIETNVTEAVVGFLC